MSKFPKQPLQKETNFRYGSLTQGTKVNLPGCSPKLTQIGYSSTIQYYSHKQIFKLVLDWYQIWQPWQQKLLVDGMLKRLNMRQWETLATMLEPIFHRDFIISVKKRYPSAPLRKAVVPTKVLERKIWDRYYFNKMQHVGEVPVLNMQQGIKQPKCSSEKLKSGKTGNVSPKSGRDSRNEPSESGKTKSARSGRTDKLPGVSKSPISCPLHNAQQLQPDDLSPSMIQPKDNAYMDSIQASFADKYAQKIITNALSQLNILIETKDKNILLSPPQECNTEAKKLQSSLISSEDIKEKSVLGSDDISTRDFFISTGLHKLGGMQREIRTGPVKKLPVIQGLFTPLQKAYKNVKWWTASPLEGRKYVKAHKGTLRKHFKEQLAQIWQWLFEWEDHEKLTLLVDVVKDSCGEVISHLAQTLNKSLHFDVDINCLPDFVFLRIFSKLSTEDIGTASQVCRRWRYLCDRDDLWMYKIQKLGVMEGIPDFTSVVIDASDTLNIDWKMAYKQLVQILETTKKTQQLEEVNATAEYLNRNIKRQYDLDIVNQKDEDVHSVNTADIWPVNIEETADDKEKLEQDDNEEDSGRSTPLNSRPLRKHLARKKSVSNDDEENTFDVRTSLVPAEDLLGRTQGDARLYYQKQDSDDKVKQGHFAGYVPNISKVRKLQGHMDVVTCLEFDARRIISGSKDCTIRVWDVRSGRSIHKFYGQKGGIRCLKFDDKFLYSGAWDTTIMVWDIVKFSHRATIIGHDGCVTCMSLNQKYLITGSEDRTIRVWSLYGYDCTNIIKGHNSAIQCLTSNDTYVFAASNRVILMSNIDTGMTVKSFMEHRHLIKTILVRGDLLLSGDVKGRVYFWDTNEAGLAAAAIQTHDASVNAITFHGGRFYTGSSDHTIKEWDLVTMTCVRCLHGHTGSVKEVRVSDKRVVSCGEDGHIRIWDIFERTKRTESTTGTSVSISKKVL